MEANSQSHLPLAIHRCCTASLPGLPWSRLSGAGSGKGPRVRILTLSLADGQTASRQTWFGTSSRVCWKLGLRAAVADAGLTPATPNTDPAGEAGVCRQHGGLVGCWPACSPRSPRTLGDLPMVHAPQGHSGKFEPACRCGSTGTSGLLDGCGPPVWHRHSQGHLATLSGSDMERALNFLRL